MARSGREEFAMGAISLLSNRLAGFGEGMLEDLTFRQWFLLTMISRMDPGEKNVREVAEFVGTSRQNVRKMIVPRERGGYLETSRSKRDARSLDVRLTPKAERFLSEKTPLVEREARRLFSGLSDGEMDALVAVLKRVMECVDAYDAEEAEGETASR